MKIKALLLLLLILSLLLTSCAGLADPAKPDDSGKESGTNSDTDAPVYQINVTGEFSLFNKTPSISNEAGKSVNFSLNEPENGYPVVKLDGETLKPTVVFGNYRYTFVMPAHDVTLEISIGKHSDVLEGDEVAITFVSLNDVHGAIEQDAYGKGGLSNAKVAIDKLSAFYGDADDETDVRDDVVLFANGDMFQGTAVSNMSRGRAVLEAMNAMEFDAMSLGNHEFDWGLDTVLAYWDGNEENGEADFPLVNSNIVQNSTGKKIADASADDNIVTSVIVEKMGVKVGLIGAIGPVANSILHSAVEPYTFADVTASVKAAALTLKSEGAEIIAVSIHMGTTSGDVTDYDANAKIAGLKDAEGNYLVDLIFNGHTHYRQKGEISRPNGKSVPVVQAGANNEYIGVVSVIYNTGSRAVTDHEYYYSAISAVGTSCDKEVEEIISAYSKDLVLSLPTLAVSAVTVQRDTQLTLYIGQVMANATGAAFACCNYGGLRSTGGIVAGGNITEANIYEIIPFDNAIYLIKIPGSAIYRIMQENSENWFFGYGRNTPDISKLQDDQNLYTFAVIDYVYTNRYFDPYRKYVAEENNTNLILRDLLIEDVKLFGDASEKWSFQSGTFIGNKLE